MLHTQADCATPTLGQDGQLALFSYYNYTVDHRWITEHAPPESGWRFPLPHEPRRGGSLG